MGTINLELVKHEIKEEEQSDVSLSDSEYQQEFLSQPAFTTVTEKPKNDKIENSSDSFSRQDNELLSQSRPTTRDKTCFETENADQENNVTVSPDNEPSQLKFNEELCRQVRGSRNLATETASSGGSEEKVIAKLKKCRVKLVRLGVATNTIMW